jgi:hypothetical protein
MQVAKRPLRKIQLIKIGDTRFGDSLMRALTPLPLSPSQEEEMPEWLVEAGEKKVEEEAWVR